MPAFSQDDRLVQVSSPLGKDVLLAISLHGSEGLSQLYRYTVEVMTVRTVTVPFDALMGQPFGVALQMPEKKFRHYHGICIHLIQAQSDTDFNYYQMEMVPRVWVLTKKSQSRIFQHITVPDILKKVFKGFDVEYQLQGKFEKRDFCVQYRETDFNFACRLMEEEGIYYFFKHDAGKHTMVLANTPEAHPDVPGPSKIIYKKVSDGEALSEDYITDVTKVQEQTSGKFTLWDHTFELPHDHNEEKKPLTDSVTVGKVSHKLQVGDSSQSEVYDWPGEYAQRFDGVNAGGGDAPGEIPKIPPDGKRTVELRMKAEAATTVRIQGGSYVRHLTSGHKLTIETLPTDKLAVPIKCDGEYVLTAVSHSAANGAGNYTGSSRAATEYSNTFTAIPSALPFLPQRVTPKPVVSGSQSAVVVGPPGEEIFTDKYGRIKVQFHWDREGKYNADSSCWIRVAQASAGRAWGSFSLPRVGQEVIVDFLEGDPDQPICVGCVYNPDQAQKYKLPDEKTKTYVRTNTSPGGDGYNEIRFEDKAGKEQVYFHAQRNMDERVRYDSFERVGLNRHLRVGFWLPQRPQGRPERRGKEGEPVRGSRDRPAPEGPQQPGRTGRRRHEAAHRRHRQRQAPRRGETRRPHSLDQERVNRQDLRPAREGSRQGVVRFDLRPAHQGGGEADLRRDGRPAHQGQPRREG